MVALWRFLAPLPTFFGIAIWAGIVWRRCNGLGAWAGVLGSILIWVWSRYYMGHELAEQVVWYLSGGILLTIAVSLLTSPQPKERLDRFYTVLHTPVGEEDKLRAAGIEVRD